MNRLQAIEHILGLERQVEQEYGANLSVKDPVHRDLDPAVCDALRALGVTDDEIEVAAR
jgi:hypothetical protein